MATQNSSQNVYLKVFIRRRSDEAALSVAFVSYDRKMFSAQCKHISAKQSEEWN